MMTNRDNLDKLIRALNHEALFNPDAELQAKFQDLLELALKVSADYDDLLQEFVNRDLGWFFGDASTPTHDESNDESDNQPDNNEYKP